jgi:VWFA-related protein
MRKFLLLLAIAVVAIPVYAQHYGDEVTVNVIEVPVHVTRGDHAVRGLKAEDFELYVNGARQPIQYFDVMEEQQQSSPAVESAAIAQPPAPLDRRRMTVLLFDSTSTSYHFLQEAKAAAEKFVATVGEDETIAVGRLGRGGVSVIVPFTRDHVAVRRAIGTLSVSRAGDAFSLATSQAERASWGDIAANASTDVPSGDAFANEDHGQFDKGPALTFLDTSIRTMRLMEAEQRDNESMAFT